MKAPKKTMKYTVTDGQAVTVTAASGDGRDGYIFFYLAGKIVIPSNGTVTFLNGAALRGKTLKISVTQTTTHASGSVWWSVAYGVSGGAAPLTTDNRVQGPAGTSSVDFEDVIEFN